MNDLDYLRLSKPARILHGLKSFFKNLPSRLLGGLKGLLMWIVGLFAGIGRFLGNLVMTYIRGDWKTKISYTVMGFGSLLRGQWLRGLLFLVFQTVFNVYMWFFGLGHISKLVTLGTVETTKINRKTVYGDNSFLIMLYGVLAVFFVLAFLYTWYVNVKQNKISEEILKSGKKLKTAKDDVHSMLDGQFHKTLLAIPTLGVTVFTILPIIFMVLVAFTNYDNQHQPPQKLFSWVGTENFETLLSSDVNPLTLKAENPINGTIMMTVNAKDGDTLTMYTVDSEENKALLGEAGELLLNKSLFTTDESGVSTLNMTQGKDGGFTLKKGSKSGKNFPLTLTAANESTVTAKVGAGEEAKLNEALALAEEKGVQVKIDTNGDGSGILTIIGEDGKIARYIPPVDEEALKAAEEAAAASDGQKLTDALTLVEGDENAEARLAINGDGGVTLTVYGTAAEEVVAEPAEEGEEMVFSLTAVKENRAYDMDAEFALTLKSEQELSATSETKADGTVVMTIQNIDGNTLTVNVAAEHAEAANKAVAMIQAGGATLKQTQNSTSYKTVTIGKGAAAKTYVLPEGMDDMDELVVAVENGAVALVMPETGEPITKDVLVQEELAAEIKTVTNTTDVLNVTAAGETVSFEVVSIREVNNGTVTFIGSDGKEVELVVSNVKEITGQSYAHTFKQVLLWTLIWAFFATFLNYFLGMLVAIMINKKGIKLKKLWRTVLVMTIAIPQFISLLYVSKMFAADGIINGALMNWGWIDEPLPFWTNATWAKCTIIGINVWIGIPYLMLIATGILMNIPADLYESARIDGANAFQTYRKITLPYMLFVTGPYLLTSFTGNINNFNVIFLLSGGKPLGMDLAGNAGNTDLLITWLYKMTVTDSNYKLAAVMGILVFVVCAVINLVVYNLIPSVKNEEDFQ